MKHGKDSEASAASATGELGTVAERADRWHQLGTGKMGAPQRRQTLQVDVAVLGGGLAGMCAAVAAARNGARTVLVQDRPLLGGNSSSEIRVHVEGANHLLPDGLPERETGIIEELLLLNRFDNPQESYPVWDHVLYDFVAREPGLEVMLNTQAIAADMSGSTIASARCWQSTTEIEFAVRADVFIDCSGDGLLAATAGALYRTGREAASEFDEKYAPKKADGWHQGASLVMSSKDMGRPMPYTPPSFALPFDAEQSHPMRKVGACVDGIWWVELGSDHDIIADHEINRHKLMGYLHGVWDYIKNSGAFPEAETFALDWMGSVPGRRESRRFIGDFILSEKDLTGHRHFEDAVAYGGWSLDEHCPGGIENLEAPPSYFHQRFSKVYEIPFRCLYSKNIPNLMFAGRNISQTHIALSSSRVMATCALMGQAAGTAAALCVDMGALPGEIAREHMEPLQEQLLRDDAFIPNRPARDPLDLARRADRVSATSTASGDADLLTDGVSRDIGGDLHHWRSQGLPAEVQFEWEHPVALSCVEIKCDTNLRRNIMMRKNSRVDAIYWNEVPPELAKALEIEVRVEGAWVKVAACRENRTRLVKLRFDPVRATAVRIRLQETYGCEDAKLFEVRCYA